jgi:hypothetical protein
MEQPISLPVVGDGTGLEQSELIHREELQRDHLGKGKAGATGGPLCLAGVELSVAGG